MVRRNPSRAENVLLVLLITEKSQGNLARIVDIDLSDCTLTG